MTTSDLLQALLAAKLAASGGILVVLALRGLVRRRFGSRLAYKLWLTVPVASLAVFLPAPAWLSLRPGLPGLSNQVSVFHVVDPGQSQAIAPAASALPSLSVILLAVWLAGALTAMALTHIAHRRGLKRFGALTLSGRNVLRAEHHGLGPALVGVLRPRLVLPSDFARRFETRERVLILAHERHHATWGDTRINALVSLVGCINWFNPLIHLAAAKLRTDQELACDAAIIARFPGERRTYGKALLKSQLACLPLPLGCTWPGRAPQLLQERLTMLSIEKPRRLRILAGGALVGALCLGSGFIAWAASAPPASTAAASNVLQRLPAEVVGVVGSGNQMTLRIRRDGVVQNLKLGDEYRDGWRLRTLTPDVATLAKGNETRRVGLNPAGALAVEAEAGEGPRILVTGNCNGNVCSGRMRGAGPRNATRVTNAIRSGDAGAALAAGGNGDDVLAAWASADGRAGVNTGANSLIGMMQTGTPVLEAIDDSGEITVRSRLPNGRDLILRREPAGVETGPRGPGG